ncbi:hypothetical protein [Longimicrobium terrae]|uniref:Type II secretion system protein GspG C-terminal domain-containing protein n=1 Tax=Longimicrobium terrae TaxID=1639882 RepID=A0A841GVH1_9BACT|nr:hypothetical protein [Longimicrobium terrae]MBB4634305.1 hypothetical protein [Longimicrobium terrae]MBB6068805.1 hypothetical protein [Longimicrobium terrae]NNC27990.1 hypothetical protein [Longimicrobium terrae]
MSKLVWCLVLLVAAVVFVKPLRERVRPEVEIALNPLYNWTVRNEVKDIQRLVAREQATTGTIPKPSEFERFIDSREGAGASLDSWGEPYFLTLTRRTYTIASAGPDRERNTADDIRTEPAPRTP